MNILSAGHGYFKDHGRGVCHGGNSSREAIIVFGKPLKAAFDSEEKTASQALTD